jgi:hypothetical protein
VLPNGTSVQTYIMSADDRFIEGVFRYDSMARHVTLVKARFAFCGEDATAIIRKVDYDSHTDTFVGFTPSLRNGFPLEKCYSTNSFDELKSWFAERDISSLLSVYVIQPLVSNTLSTASYLLSAHGTNGRYNSLDIIRRWIEIVQQSMQRNVRVIGFASDCDPKFLKAMRLAIGLFASMPNMPIEKHPNAFNVGIPINWKWFFLRREQFFLCMQDSVHLCTKMRNRLLSSNATLFLGNHRISVEYLFALIETSIKLNHGLVRSQIIPKDRQNYDSCVRISSDDVLRELEQIPDSEATLLYLKVS